MSINYIEKINHANIEEKADLTTSLKDQLSDIVFDSLIEAFGLNMFFSDKDGGDVDTVHNVRQIDNNDKAKTITLLSDTKVNHDYKDKKHKEEYKNIGEYNKGKDYDSGTNFRSSKAKARKEFQETGIALKDDYTGKTNIGFHGKTKEVSPQNKAEREHIIPTSTIHKDRGRVLAGMTGEELANSKSNLCWTNKSLNASLGNSDKEDYVRKHQNLDDTTKANILEKNAEAKKAYNTAISKKYYTSKDFLSSTGKAAGIAGLKMGAKEVVGIILAEIWFEVKDRIDQIHTSGESMLMSIAEGIKKGFENAKANFRELINKFLSSAIMGALSSLVTTLINAFVTTGKNIVKIIRETFSSLVEAARIIFINPDNLALGDRLKAVAKILAVAASVVAGSVVSELIGNTGIGQIPIIGEIIQSFVGMLVTGVMSCLMVYLLDNNETIQRAVATLNSFEYYTKAVIEDLITNNSFLDWQREQSRILDEYCAKALCIDLKVLRAECNTFIESVEKLENAKNDQEVNYILKNIYTTLEMDLPWKGYESMDSFMRDSKAKLVFS